MATDISEVQTGKSKRVDASEKRLIIAIRLMSIN